MPTRFGLRDHLLENGKSLDSASTSRGKIAAFRNSSVSSATLMEGSSAIFSLVLPDV